MAPYKRKHCWHPRPHHLSPHSYCLPPLPSPQVCLLPCYQSNSENFRLRTSLLSLKQKKSNSGLTQGRTLRCICLSNVILICAFSFLSSHFPILCSRLHFVIPIIKVLWCLALFPPSQVLLSFLVLEESLFDSQTTQNSTSMNLERMLSFSSLSPHWLSLSN